MTNKLTIDPEFQNLFPQLPSDTYNALKKSIAEQGCLDRLKVWRDGDKDILIDGYHRKAACDELTKANGREVPYQVQLMDFDTRLDALLFVIDLHRGRRHLTPQQMSFYRGEKYNSLKSKHGGDRKSVNGSSAQNAHLIGDGKSSGQNDHLKTAEALAEQEGVSAGTVRRDAEYAEDVKAVGENVGEEVKSDILSGKLPATKDEVSKLAKAPKKAAKKAVKAVKEGKAKSVSAALEQEEPKADEPVCDKLGNAVPEHLLPVFKDSIASRLLTSANAVRSGIRKELANSVEHNWLLVEAINQAEKVATALKDIKAHCLCLACKGKKGGCKVCRQTGYWPKKFYDSEEAKGNL